MLTDSLLIDDLLKQVVFLRLRFHLPVAIIKDGQITLEYHWSDERAKELNDMYVEMIGSSIRNNRL